MWLLIYKHCINWRCHIATTEISDYIQWLRKITKWQWPMLWYCYSTYIDTTLIMADECTYEIHWLIMPSQCYINCLLSVNEDRIHTQRLPHPMQHTVCSLGLSSSQLHNITRNKMWWKKLLHLPEYDRDDVRNDNTTLVIMMILFHLNWNAL